MHTNAYLWNGKFNLYNNRTESLTFTEKPNIKHRNNLNLKL